MNDVDCPYCGAPQEINHDDGYGYEEDKLHEQQCGKCERHFVFTTQVSFYYTAYPAPCLNGVPHKMKPVVHYPKHWPDYRRCADCGHEERGDYVPNP
jgi:hypothetical protein